VRWGGGEIGALRNQVQRGLGPQKSKTWEHGDQKVLRGPGWEPNPDSHERQRLGEDPRENEGGTMHRQKALPSGRDERGRFLLGKRSFKKEAGASL